MHNPLGMRRRQRIGNLHRNVEKMLQVQRLAFDARLQALALQLLHHDERMAIVVLNVVDDADIRMIELRRRSRLARKPL